MKEIARLILVLVLICLAAALALSQVYSFTKGPIENALREERLRAIRTVLPSYDNEPDRDVVGVVTGVDDEGGEIVTDYYIGRSGEDIVGIAFEASSPVAQPVRYTEASIYKDSDSEPDLSDEEMADVQEKLRGWGYAG